MASCFGSETFNVPTSNSPDLSSGILKFAVNEVSNHDIKNNIHISAQRIGGGKHLRYQRIGHGSLLLAI